MAVNRLHVFEESLKSINFFRMSLVTKSLILHGVITRLHEEGGYSFSTINKILIENSVKGKSSMSRFYKMAVESGKEIDDFAFEKEVGLVSNNKENGITQKSSQNSSTGSIFRAITQKSASTSASSTIEVSKQNDGNQDNDKPKDGTEFYRRIHQKRPTIGISTQNNDD